MPFVNENINQVIEAKRKTNSDFKKAWNDSREKYRFIIETISSVKKEK